MTRRGRRDPNAEASRASNVLDHLARHLQDLRPRRIVVLGEGDFCRAYLVDGHTVVRIPKHREASEALRREACLMPRLSPGLSLPVPVPAFHAAGGPRGTGRDADRRHGVAALARAVRDLERASGRIK